MSKETKKDNQEQKKPFWKKWWFWVLIVAVLIGGVIESTEPKTQESAGSTTVAQITAEATTESETKENTITEESATTTGPETENSKETENFKETEELTIQLTDLQDNPEKFLQSIREAIQGQIGENEYITDITLENENLCIYVDLSKVDPTPLSMEDLAILRTASITDKILEFTECNNLWQTVTIDFKDFGYIRNDKQDIKDGEYGKYFPEENFKLVYNLSEEIQKENEQTTENAIKEAIESVVTKEKLEDFNYVPSNNFSLIKFKGSENLTNTMTVKGMYLDMFNILKKIQPIIDTNVDFNVVYPLVDQYGSIEDVIVIKATFTNETIKKIDFRNAIWENIPIIADDWWNHNAVNIND